MDKNNTLKPVKKFKIITPHNDLFLRVMTRKEKAIAFFKRCVPKKILQVTDLNQMEMMESKHTSDTGHSFYNDLLYRCPLLKGGTQIGHLIISCEHQSKPDPKMVLRIAKYNMATIEDHVKQGHDKFPILLNVVFHTGKKPWSYSLTFSNYYPDPALGSQYLNMAPCIFVKVPANKEDEIYTDKDLGFCFAAFCCGRAKDAYQEFEKFKQNASFKKYFDKLPVEERKLAGEYIGLFIDKNKYDLGKIVNLIIINEQEKEEFMRSVAQEYIQQGMQQGIQTKAKEVAKNMFLKLHLDIDAIQEATGLSKEEIQEVLRGMNNHSN